MKKFLNVFLLIFIFASCKSTYVYYDTYLGNLNKIIKELGNKYEVTSYIVNENYNFISEIEPDYFKYFSNTEKEGNIEIYEYRWKKGGKNILVWGKEIDGIIVGFSSVEYKGDIKFYQQ